MYLSRIELTGFKSFANKTELVFEPGVTAIVGPNGSGKSNVSDAIRWVLGEQSSKQLRGASREDVIFSGTAQKARLGMAEVSLVLNNEDRQVPIDLPEITITRRYDRSGESTYLLNKAKVRLLDIQELLAKAGFAGSTYSVISQGMIDSLVTATPKERRELFEDAAGIRPYQLKRKRALGKLSRSETHLEEVDAHIRELTPQLKSLKRQADRAEKRASLQTEQRLLRESVYNHLWNAARHDRAQAETATQTLTTQEQELVRTAESIEQRIDQLAQELKQTHSQDAEARLEQRTKEQQIRDRLTEERSVVRGRLQVEQQQSSSIDTADLARRIEDLEREHHRAQEDVVAAQKAHKVAQSNEEVAQTALHETQKALSSTQTRQQELQQRAAEIQIQLTAHDTHDADTAERARLQKQHTELTEQLAAAHEERDAAYTARTNASAAAQTAQQHLASALEQIDSLQSRIRALDISQEASLTLVDVRDRLSTTLAQERAVLDEASHVQHEAILSTCFGHMARTHGVLQELCKQLQQETGDASSEAVREVRQLRHNVNALLATQTDLQRAAQEAEVASAVTLRDLESSLEQIERVQTDLASTEAALKDVEARLSSDTSSLMAELTSSQEATNEQLEATRETLEAQQAALSSAQAEYQQAQSARAEAGAHARSLEQQATRLYAEQEKLQQRLTAAQEQEAQKGEKAVLVQELTQQLEEIESSLAACTERITALNEAIEQDEQAQKERQTAVFAAEQELRETQKQLTAIRERVRQQAIQQTRAEERQAQLREELFEALGEALQDHLARYEAAPLSLITQDEADTQHARLQAVDKQLLMIGDLPHDILEQYNETQERHTFLTQQREDVLTASQKLQTVIDELDTTMKAQFDAAFTDINKQFDHYFQILFRGGSASVKKETIVLEQDDPEASSDATCATVTQEEIDITATPPGKKVSSLSMLSGGEKALTSIALMLAIIHHNPSPFIVLDEVDAALDEANAERFARVIEEASSDQSQFIVITHARATMLRAQALYGVTMQESGVSKLLSVKLDQAERLATQSSSSNTSVSSQPVPVA